MITRDSFKHLVGIPYKSGQDDCYGLALQFYHDVYGISLVDAARPDGWWDAKDMDLINQFVSRDGWIKLGVNTRILRPGDGLIFSLISGKANHVGCYVGNGMFIHHVYGRYSCEEALMDKWTSRLLSIIRHPEVTQAGAGMTKRTHLRDIP